MMKEKTLVRFRSRFEPGFTRGYILDLGPEFFLLLLVSDQLRFDGFECLRLRDIKGLKRDPYAEFDEAALRLKGQEVTEKPKVDLKDVSKLLRSVAKLSDFVTIEREEINPDVCWIGQITAVRKADLYLVCIGPDAVWNKKPTICAIDDVTRVAWGGEYEDALALVSNHMAETR